MVPSFTFRAVYPAEDGVVVLIIVDLLFTLGGRSPRSGPPSHPRSSTTAAGPSGVTNGESSTAIAPEDDQPQDVSKSLPSAEGEEKVDDDEDDDTVLSWISPDGPAAVVEDRG
jgi:hypothetical protein